MSSGPWKWTKRIGGGLALLIILAAIAGFISQKGADKAILEYPPPGKLVDIGGYRLHIRCIGDGSPTVLFESGGGGPMIHYIGVQDEVAKFTRVCTYDRAGLGWSDASPHPRDGEHVAAELDLLLTAAEISGPYILIGHSLGGLYARVFASRHHDNVVGLILMDSSHEDQYERFPPQLKPPQWLQVVFRLAPIITPIGIHKLLGYCNPGPADARERALFCHSRNLGTGGAELWAFDATGVQAKEPLGDIPVIVLSADPETSTRGFPTDLKAPVAAVLIELQEDFLRLSTDSSRVVAKGCGHQMVECPQIVIDTIRSAVDKSRQKVTAAEPPAL